MTNRESRITIAIAIAIAIAIRDSRFTIVEIKGKDELVIITIVNIHIIVWRSTNCEPRNGEHNDEWVDLFDSPSQRKASQADPPLTDVARRPTQSIDVGLIIVFVTGAAHILYPCGFVPLPRAI